MYLSPGGRRDVYFPLVTDDGQSSLQMITVMDMNSNTLILDEIVLNNQTYRLEQYAGNFFLPPIGDSSGLENGNTCPDQCPAGPPGLPGKDGKEGRQGKPGVKGSTGGRGPPGSRGVKGQTGKRRFCLIIHFSRVRKRNTCRSYSLFQLLLHGQVGVDVRVIMKVKDGKMANYKMAMNGDT